MFQDHDLDPRPGSYYVSVRNGNGYYILAAGPFFWHWQALDYVNEVSRIANKYDYRSPWYSYGTCRLHDDQKPTLGAMNGLLGIQITAKESA